MCGSCQGHGRGAEAAAGPSIGFQTNALHLLSIVHWGCPLHPQSASDLWVSFGPWIKTNTNGGYGNSGADPSQSRVRTQKAPKMRCCQRDPLAKGQVPALTLSLPPALPLSLPLSLSLSLYHPLPPSLSVSLCKWNGQAKSVTCSHLDMEWTGPSLSQTIWIKYTHIYIHIYIYIYVCKAS